MKLTLILFMLLMANSVDADYWDCEKNNEPFHTIFYEELPDTPGNWHCLNLETSEEKHFIIITDLSPTSPTKNELSDYDITFEEKKGTKEMVKFYWVVTIIQLSVYAAFWIVFALVQSVYSIYRFINDVTTGQGNLLKRWKIFKWLDFEGEPCGFIVTFFVFIIVLNFLWPLIYPTLIIIGILYATRGFVRLKKDIRKLQEK